MSRGEFAAVGEFANSPDPCNCLWALTWPDSCHLHTVYMSVPGFILNWTELNWPGFCPNTRPVADSYCWVCAHHFLWPPPMPVLFPSPWAFRHHWRCLLSLQPLGDPSSVHQDPHSLSVLWYQWPGLKRHHAPFLRLSASTCSHNSYLAALDLE